MASATNGTLSALCPNCTILKELEACRHCYQPLCNECRDTHITAWKIGATKYCENLTKKCEKYLLRINSLNPLIDQNESNITKVKAELEKVFEQFVENLKEQKNDLFLKLDEIKKENEQFKSFESDIILLKSNLSDFQETVKMNESDKILLQFNKFQDCRDGVAKIGVNYAGLKKKPFKIVGEYEKPDKLNLEKNFFGNLIINESDILKSISPNTKDKHQKLKSKKDLAPAANFDTETNNNDVEKSKVHMFGTLRVKLKRLVEQIQEIQIAKTPIIEVDLQIMPKFIANFNNLIYICDEEGNLAIAEFRSLNSIESFAIKYVQKLNFNGIRALTVNKKFLAVSYLDTNPNANSNPTKNDSKQNRQSLKSKPPCGVAIFKISEPTMQFDKVIDKVNPKNLNFISPNGIMLNNDNFLFVCDRELHGIFKFEAKTGNLVQKFIYTNDQEPSGLALLLDTSKHFMFTDSLKLELNLVESSQFSVVKSVKLTDDYNLSFNEPFDIVATQISEEENNTKDVSSLVFIKHRTEYKVMVYDTGLNLKYSFDYEYSNGQGINYFRLNGKNDFILIGYFNPLDTDVKTRYKLGIFSDFP